MGASGVIAAEQAAGWAAAGRSAGDQRRPKDLRRIATRYDKLAVNFVAAVCLAATVSYWL